MNKNTTVGDCLNLSALREAELIAGAKGLNRPVSSVSVLEWPVVEALSKDVLSRSARRIFCTGDFALEPAKRRCGDSRLQRPRPYQGKYTALPF